MAVDPRLRQGLLGSEDDEVKHGGQILDQCEPCDDRQRECKDTFWALLFFGTAAVVATLALYSAVGRGSYFLVPGRFSFEIGAAAAVAVGGAMLFLALARRHTVCVIWTALLAFPALLVIAGLLLGGTYGIALVAIGVCLICCVHCCWKAHIPFTALLIQTAISVMQAHRGMLAISLLGAALSMSWCLLCASASLGLLVSHGASRGSREGDYAAYFVQCLVLLWGSMVAFNACHVACCGVFGRWYFGRDQDSPVSRSTRTAFVHSFGSVCFGSFVVAFVRALEYLLKALQREAREEGNMVMCIVACVVGAVISCIGDIIEWFNKFAYVQCALRGLGFVDAARATYALCTFSRCHMICADSLVSTVAFFGALLAGALGAVALLLLGSHWVLVGAVVSLVVAMAALQPLESGVTALIVCWAENPGALARRKPELAAEFARRGHDWDGNGGEVGFAVLQPQPGAVGGTAATPMVEMTARPPRQMAVTVPEGVMPGQLVQIHTPEGQTLEVEVPLGYGPGSQFLAAY